MVRSQVLHKGHIARPCTATCDSVWKLIKRLFLYPLLFLLSSSSSLCGRLQHEMPRTKRKSDGPDACRPKSRRRETQSDVRVWPPRREHEVKRHHPTTLSQDGLTPPTSPNSEFDTPNTKDTALWHSMQQLDDLNQNTTSYQNSSSVNQAKFSPLAIDTCPSPPYTDSLLDEGPQEKAHLSPANSPSELDTSPADLQTKISQPVIQSGLQELVRSTEKLLLPTSQLLCGSRPPGLDELPEDLLHEIFRLEHESSDSLLLGLERIPAAAPPIVSWPSSVPSLPKLDNMPAEVLQQIFWYAREPCLIHTCRRLYQLLPTFPLYTRALTFQAMVAAPLQDSLDPTLNFPCRSEDPLEDISKKCGDVCRLQTPMPEDERHELQQQVFSSKWFTLQHFEDIYHGIFQALVFALFLKQNPFDLSTGQVERVTNFARSVGPLITRPVIPMELNLRLWPQDKPLKLEICENSVRLTTGRQGRLLREWNMIRLTYIPDCVFAGHDTYARQEALKLAIVGAVFDPQAKIRVSCSHSLLQKALRSTVLRARHASATLFVLHEFDNLLLLDRHCFAANQERGVINFDMMILAARSQDRRCVQRLLESAKHYDKGYRPGVWRKLQCVTDVIGTVEASRQQRLLGKSAPRVLVLPTNWLQPGLTSIKDGEWSSKTTRKYRVVHRPRLSNRRRLRP